MTTRRDFLRASLGTGAASFGGFEVSELVHASQPAKADVTPDIVQFSADIEPIVRKIETTPRERCPEMLAAELKSGLPYRRALAAIYLAGIRNVNPQPPGFKFHCVFVMHAVHQFILDAPEQERMLPLFWSLDSFKKSQQQDVEQGDFRLKPLSGNPVSPASAWNDFHAAMRAWDAEKADRAIVALVRNCGANELIEGVWQYGARDFRNIGHKAIFVANTWRTLQTIGWQHAEPAFRSLILGLLDFGRQRRVNGFGFDDQSYVANSDQVVKQAAKLPADWTLAKPDPAITRDILVLLRTGSITAVSTKAIELLQSGAAKAQAIWDAAHLAAGELMMQQPGIYGIHTVTSINALHYGFEAAGTPATRLLMLLQGLGWMCQFRAFMSTARGGLNDKIQIDAIRPGALATRGKAALDELFSQIGKDKTKAAATAFALAPQLENLEEFASQARSLIFRKGTDAHDYKYASAILEDMRLVSPAYRPHHLATATYHLKGSAAPDSPLTLKLESLFKKT